MIVLYIGRRGNGKTTTMVKDGYNYYCEGWRIYTNMVGLKFPHTYIPTEDIINLHNSNISGSVILIDEIQAIISSRRSMKKGNLSFSNFIHEVRKRGIIILSTTQKSRRVDVDYREQVDIKATPKIHHEYPVIECSYLDLTAEEDGIYDSVATIVYNPQEVYKLFDSYEKVKSVN